MKASLVFRASGGLFRRLPFASGVSLLALALAAGSATTSPAVAQTETHWTGTVSTDWFEAGNWAGGLLPDPSLNVTVNDGTHRPVIAGGGQAATGHLVVGASNPGTLGIEDGLLDAYHMTIGMDGGDGTVSVTGPNALLNAQTAITLGLDGMGRLEIREGGSFTSNQGIVGDGADSSGTVVVDGPGSNWSTRIPLGMFVGLNGHGDFTVSNAGSVNTETTYLGYNPGSSGRLTITGDGSAWLDDGDMYVGGGLWSSGTLDVNEGGFLRVSNTLYVGFGGEGTVSVSGEDTRVEVGGDLAVGVGQSGAVAISSGAAVESEGGTIGVSAGVQGVVNVADAGSSWIMPRTGSLTIGLLGNGMLTVTNGARLETGDLHIASFDDAVGTLVVSEGGHVSAAHVMMSGASSTNGAVRLESDGILETGQVERYSAAGNGVGIGTVTFDGGTLRLTGNQGYLFQGFQIGDLTLEMGGGTIDTQGYNIQTDLGFVGSGGLTKTGTGTLEFWASNNSYSGDTVVSAGTLRARAANVLSAASTHEIASGATLRLDNNRDQAIGALAGAGNVLLGNSTLNAGGNDASTTFGGVISGAGSLVKTGSGGLTLAGNNTYTGTTRVLDGVLNVTGSIVSALEVSSGGRVGGTGTMGAVTVGDGGIFAPGNSIGTITVGTLTLATGSVYAVELIGGGNTPGVHNDLTMVTGPATIEAGAMIHVLPENGTDTGVTYAPNTVYTIIRTAAPGSLVIDAAPSISNNFAFLDFIGSHDGQNFYLTSSGVAASFCLPGASANQCAAGNAIHALGGGNTIFDTVVGMSEPEANAAFDALSGEMHASAQHVVDRTFAMFGDALHGQARAGLATPAGANAANVLGYAPIGVPAEGMRAIAGATSADAAAQAWLAPLGGRGTIEADGDGARLDWWGAGLAVGYEGQIETASGTASGGLALGHVRSQGTLDARRSDVMADTVFLGAYGGWSDGPFSLTGSLAYGAGHQSTSRRIDFGGVEQTARGDYWLHGISASAELAYGLEIGEATTVSPLFVLDAGWSGHGGFTETGAGALNLTGAAQGAARLDAGLGLALAHTVLTDAGAVTFEGRVVWEHAVAGAAPSQNLAFAAGGGFAVSGTQADNDRLRLGLGLAYETEDGVNLKLSYGGLFSDAEHTHGLRAALSVAY
jgi:T5SS/PEP-CTERM-associated repeat protein/autotransporter-associated beta strand protein